jgi:hypothetical protein
MPIMALRWRVAFFASSRMWHKTTPVLEFNIWNVSAWSQSNSLSCLELGTLKKTQPIFQMT